MQLSIIRTYFQGFHYEFLKTVTIFYFLRYRQKLIVYAYEYGAPFVQICIWYSEKLFAGINS